MKHRYEIGLVVILLLAFTRSGVSAQDIAPDAEPLNGTIHFEAGSPLDPFLIRVEAGGVIDAETFDEDCIGYVAQAPNVVLNWSGETDELNIFTFSDIDATLLVVLPDGNVLCSDDFDDNILDAHVEVKNPPSGRYAIFVGGYYADEFDPALLIVSERDVNPSSFFLSDLVARDNQTADLDAPGLPLAASEMATTDSVDDAPLVTVPNDLEDDVYRLETSGGGEVPLFMLDTGDAQCSGFADGIPALRIDVPEATALLHIFFNGETDSTLLILAPDEQFFCNDDSTVGDSINLNPSIDILDPSPGEYRVYIGTFDPETLVDGTLFVTVSGDVSPGILTLDPEMGGE